MRPPAPGAKRPITVAEYRAMHEAGRFARPNRIELLAGEIHEAASMGSRHAACVGSLTEFFIGRLAGRVIVRVQCPIELDRHSEPEPDLALVTWRRNRYADAHPRPPDVLLVVEVSETTYGFDRSVKLPLYAAAGVVEVWIVRLDTGTVEVYRDPSHGGYETLEERSHGQRVAPRLLGEVVLEVSDLLP